MEKLLFFGKNFNGKIKNSSKSTSVFPIKILLYLHESPYNFLKKNQIKPE